MKSWRTITAAALVALAPASALLAGGKCEPTLNLTSVFPLVMCVERSNSTSQNVGNYFPWANDSFAFANYRNQWLYPSKTLSDVAAQAATIESIHSRSVSFTGGGAITYATAAADANIEVGRTPAGSLVRTFVANRGASPSEYLLWNGPKTIGTTVGPKGAILSDFTSRSANPLTRNDLTVPIDLRTLDLSKTNILVDTLMRGNKGGAFLIWDAVSGACSEPKRAYGSGSFVNPNALTTAYGIDLYTFIWVFRGLSLPPPSTVQQQIAEIIRLLITPEGLRCAGLDLTVDGKVNDDALNFPGGKDWDAISPQVSNGNPMTGEEEGKARNHGWN
jgi:hypothetical protein